MGMFDWLFPNPAENGSMDYLKQIPESVRPYFQKYFETGQNQLPGLSNTFGGLMNDPTGKLNQIGAGYKESPGFKWNLSQGEQAIDNAAAAGGMAGSNQHQQQAGQLATNLANQDYQDFLKNALGLFGIGTEGSMGLAKMGQTAGSSMADMIAQALSGQAGLKYAGQANQNNETGSFLNSIIQALASHK